MAKSAAERQAARRERDPEGVAAVKAAFRERHRDRLNAESRARRVRERDKERARKAVANAIRDRRLERGLCAHRDQGDCHGRIEAHHPSYARPLDVVWFCARHHKREDRR
jgi:hypothetical protein